MSFFQIKLLATVLLLLLSLSFTPTVEALELQLNQLNLSICDTADPASKQPKGYRSGCYILDGQITNTAKSTIKDVDVFAFIYVSFLNPPPSPTS